MTSHVVFVFVITCFISELQVVANFVDIPTRMKMRHFISDSPCPSVLVSAYCVIHAMIAFCLVPEVTALDTPYVIRTVLSDNKH